MRVEAFDQLLVEAIKNLPEEALTFMVDAGEIGQLEVMHPAEDAEGLGIGEVTLLLLQHGAHA